MLGGWLAGLLCGRLLLPGCCTVCVLSCDACCLQNMLVCAPTGAGKTNVAMLTMLHEIGLHRWAAVVVVWSHAPGLSASRPSVGAG